MPLAKRLAEFVCMILVGAVVFAVGYTAAAVWLPVHLENPATLVARHVHSVAPATSAPVASVACTAMRFNDCATLDTGNVEDVR